MAEVRPVLPEIRRAGGDVVIVGTGDPFAAQVFRDDLKIPDVEVFSDERRAAFALAGFHRGITTLLRPQAIGNYLRAFLAGHATRKVTATRARVVRCAAERRRYAPEPRASTDLD